MPRRLLTSLTLLLTALPTLPGAADERGSAAGDLLPHTVTLNGDKIPLDQALMVLTKQTGVPVADRRDGSGAATLTLHLDGTPFWPALDAIAREAGARVSLYQSDRVLALVPSTARPLPTAYGGVFRAVAKRLTATRDLETDTHSCDALVEFTWEPWFEPLLFEVRSWSATYGPDASGKALQVHGQGRNRVEVRGRPAIEFDLRCSAPARSATKVASLKGTVAAVGPRRMLTARFDRLTAVPPGRKPREHTEEGVTVALRRLEVLEDPDRWEVEIGLSYPPGGPTFESYQDWLGNSSIYLEKPTIGGRQPIRLQPSGEQRLQHTRETPGQAVIVYYFKEGKDRPRLGSPSDWTLVYRTPGPMLEVTAPFEFKDLPLP